MGKNKELEHKDDLTGLPNRTVFLEELEKAIESSGGSGKEFSIALLDLDFFKKANDKYGHEMGDRILTHISSFVSKNLNTFGKVYRYGGEEFVILFENLEKESAFLKLEETRKGYSQTGGVSVWPDKSSVHLTFSAGISSFPSDGTRADELLRRADEALYRAKETGRNKILLSREEKMVPKTSHYTAGQIGRLQEMSKKLGIGEAVLLREGLDDLIQKYQDKQFQKG